MEKNDDSDTRAEQKETSGSKDAPEGVSDQQAALLSLLKSMHLTLLYDFYQMDFFA